MTFRFYLDSYVFFVRFVFVAFSKEFVYFERSTVLEEEQLDWSSCDAKLSSVKLVAKGVIEEEIGAAQADFANKYISGGTLTGGCVQEEIR